MKYKVLFIHANNSLALFKEKVEKTTTDRQESNDYLTDAIYLELKGRSDFDVYDCPAMLHMYSESITDINNITGFGFALRKKLKGEPNSLNLEETISKIEDNFFDLIITDSRTMNQWWSDRGLSPFYEHAKILKDNILRYYPKNKIILLDGEDQPESILSDFYGKCLYFKRELRYNDDNLIPIGYCFPQQYFRKSTIEDKIRSVATCRPWEKNTYIFNNENDFYEDYRTSFFGLTCKKLGWDCFRHHEIIFSSCLPIFPDVDNCPVYTMTQYPKDICKKILKMDVLKDINFSKNWISYPPDFVDGLYKYNLPHIDVDRININQYQELLDEILEFSFNNNSSKKVVDYILNFTK
jgi:hypothetical protein